ncbi:MAG TPA: 50S ribosomal protein L11 [Candidatus Azoamicus sp. MARI]
MKKIEARVKVQLKAQEANPSPPVGPVLGSKGLNIMKFCSEFNLKCKEIKGLEKGTLVAVLIYVYFDKSFDFTIKYTPTSILLKNLLKIDKGSSNPSKNIIATIDRESLDLIFEKKKIDLIFNSKEQAIKSIIGTAKSMGIVVK